MRLETRNVNSLLDEDIYRLALDPAKSFSPPRKTPNVPFFNFSILDNNLDMLSNAISIYEKAYYEKDISPENIIYLNKLLYQSERLLTRDHGLPNRPWYKHHIYAPGFYTGYGVKTIPGVREAIEENDFEIVDQQIIIVADIIKDLANNLLDASNLFY